MQAGNCVCICSTSHSVEDFANVINSDLQIISSDPDLSVNMECDGDFGEPHTMVSSSVFPMKLTSYSTDLSVSMECYDDNVSPIILPEVDTSEMLQCSDLDMQLDAVNENDCNNNTNSLCHACGFLEGCQCVYTVTDDHNYASYRPTVRTHKRTGVQLTRKRTRNCSEWKSTKRKKLRQQGKAYVKSTGAMAKAKAVQRCTYDHEACRFKCAVRFDEVSRQILNTEHWSLTDDEKRMTMATTYC